MINFDELFRQFPNYDWLERVKNVICNHILFNITMRSIRNNFEINTTMYNFTYQLTNWLIITNCVSLQSLLWSSSIYYNETITLSPHRILEPNVYFFVNSLNKCPFIIKRVCINELCGIIVIAVTRSSFEALSKGSSSIYNFDQHNSQLALNF